MALAAEADEAVELEAEVALELALEPPHAANAKQQAQSIATTTIDIRFFRVFSFRELFAKQH